MARYCSPNSLAYFVVFFLWKEKQTRKKERMSWKKETKKERMSWKKERNKQTNKEIKERITLCYTWRVISIAYILKERKKFEKDEHTNKQTKNKYLFKQNMNKHTKKQTIKYLFKQIIPYLWMTSSLINLTECLRNDYRKKSLVPSQANFRIYWQGTKDIKEGGQANRKWLTLWRNECLLPVTMVMIIVKLKLRRSRRCRSLVTAIK